MCWKGNFGKRMMFNLRKNYVPVVFGSRLKLIVSGISLFHYRQLSWCASVLAHASINWTFAGVARCDQYQTSQQ